MTTGRLIVFASFAILAGYPIVETAVRRLAHRGCCGGANAALCDWDVPRRRFRMMRGGKS